MKQIVALYLAQAREFLRDRSALLFVLLLPVAFGVFFGLIFSEGGSFSLQLGVVNEDRGPIGEEIIAALQAPEAQQGIGLHPGNREQLLADLEQGKVHVLIVLPYNLSARLGAGEQATVEVFYDTANPTSSDIGLGMVRSLLNDLGVRMSTDAPMFALQTKAIQSEPLRSIDFYMPGMLSVALLWLGVFGTAQPVVAQRETQVLRRIGVTPVAPSSILAAEVAWRVSVGLLQTGTFLLIGYFGFDVGVKSWLPFAVTILLGSLVFVSLGYVLAGVGRSLESTMTIAQLINFPMMMLSGSIFSADMLPSFFRPIVNALPLTYLSDLLRHTMVGAPAVHTLGTNFAVLGGWLLVLMVLAWKLWRWE
ncbi:MAG: ABC transporter permease [Anaerolineales bacterium]|nr:ABC transporter permease [Anaerolineales bacterium]